MTPAERRRLEALEGKGSPHNGELKITAGLSDEQCAEIYSRMLREPEPLDPETEAALDRLDTEHEAYEAYRRMLRGDTIEQAVNFVKGRRP
jgi:hypothetical protein